MRVRHGSWLAVAMVSVLAACASGGGNRPLSQSETYGALSAESAVSQFLDAAKRNDYRLMARLFGTREGPAERDLGRVEVEQRMFILASLLRHESYALRSVGISEAEGKQRILAEMTGTRNGAVRVPFVLVSSGGRWFVEQIVTDDLTSG